MHSGDTSSSTRPRIIDARFVGQPGGTFAVRGINVDRDVAIIGAGLSFCITPEINIYGSYDILTSDGYSAHAGTGGLMLTW